MKKASLALVALVLVLGVVVFSGCKPEDTEPPTISAIKVEVGTDPNYRSEISGNIIKGVVDVVVTATDNVGIKEVILLVDDKYVDQPISPYVDDTTVAGDTYTFKWHTYMLKDSVSYSVRAAVYDEAGNADTSEALTYLIRIPNVAPDAATLASPDSNSSILNAFVTFVWRGNDPDTLPSQALLYDVYFGTNPNNLELVATDLPDDDSITWSTGQIEDFYLVPETDYYWRILSKDPYGLETPSSIYKFTRPVNNAPYFNPYTGQITPVEEAELVFSGPDTVKFSWTISDVEDDPMTYRFYLSQDPGTSPVYVSDLELRDTLVSSNYKMVLSPGYTYYWRAVGVDYWGDFEPLESTAAWSFTITEE